MKARIKATGEVFEIASYATIPMECCDSFGEPLCFCLDDVEILSEGNDLKESNVSDYWTRLEHTYAGMAMQGILTNPIGFENIRARGTNIQIETALLASEFAHALVQKMKENEKAMH